MSTEYESARGQRATANASLPPLAEFLSAESALTQKYANSYYGHQARTPGRPLSQALQGKFETAQTTRWYQLNQVVTSGVTPRGTPSGFDPECHHLIERVKREALYSDGLVFSHAESVIASTQMPMRQALERASELSARIRGNQTLLDGNHRTALMSFVMSLAESSVLIKPSFSIYKAYIIISARQHPGNVGNMLNDAALSDVAGHLFHYARTRVKPGTPDWPYLDAWAEDIRRLPVYNSMIETEYRKLHLKTGVFDGGEEMETLKEQIEAWKRLNPTVRYHISLAHPNFQPGSSK